MGVRIVDAKELAEVVACDLGAMEGGLLSCLESSVVNVPACHPVLHGVRDTWRSACDTFLRVAPMLWSDARVAALHENERSALHKNERNERNERNGCGVEQHRDAGSGREVGEQHGLQNDGDAGSSSIVRDLHGLQNDGDAGSVSRGREQQGYASSPQDMEEQCWECEPERQEVFPLGVLADGNVEKRLRGGL